MTYDIYIDRATEPTTLARSRLAAAISSRWNVPQDSIEVRLKKGRVRVKSGLPEDRARKVAADLVGMGAIVSVVDSTTGAPLALAVPAPAPAPAAAASGFGGGAAPAFELESVDDDDEQTQVSAVTSARTMYDPDNPVHQEEVIAPVEVPVNPAAQAPPMTLEPQNLMPPAPGAPSRAPPSPAPSAQMPSTPSGAMPVRVSGAVAVQSAPRRPPPGANVIQAFFFERTQLRIVAGVGVAMLLGLITSAIYVSSAQGSGYQPIVDELVEYQSKDLSLSQWQTELPQLRKETVQRLSSRQSTVKFMSIIVWLIVSGGFSFAWFRYIC